MDGFEIIHVMKWYYDRRKTNFLKKLKHAGLHVLIPFQFKFEIDAKNTSKEKK